jgi:hypothetical protein
MFKMIKKYTSLLIVPVFVDAVSGLKILGSGFSETSFTWRLNKYSNS